MDEGYAEILTGEMSAISLAKPKRLHPKGTTPASAARYVWLSMDPAKTCVAA